MDSFRQWSPAIPCACRSATVSPASVGPAAPTTVFFTNGASEELIAIPVGAFADPAFPPPQISVWEERKHGWVVVPDEAEHIQ